VEWRGVLIVGIPVVVEGRVAVERLVVGGGGVYVSHVLGEVVLKGKHSIVNIIIISLSLLMVVYGRVSVL
jgi:hypothetical protein